MKILVIGLGSMGKRRIRLLNQFFENNEIVGVDSREDRCRECAKIYSIHTSVSLENALEETQFDCAFICTSPLMHFPIIKKCLESELHVFTEINLTTNGYDELIELSRKKGKILFLSSTFIYKKEIQYITDKVENTKGKKNYIYHIGQYLPDWHPWENFDSYFIGDKRTNGCREILAIELPWITKLFGQVQEFYVLSEKITELNIDYKDCYHILMQHADGTVGSLIVDVVSRKAVRKLEIFGENLFIEWHGTPDDLWDYDYMEKTDRNIVNTEKEHVEGYAEFIDEMAYVNEMDTFFKQVNDGVIPPYTFEDDYYTLELIEEIEKKIYG